jgi:hypothetical protein
VPDIHESGIQARHEALNAPYKNVPYGKIVVGFLIVDLYQFSVFKQRNLNLRGGGIDDKFFFHGHVFGLLPECPGLALYQSNGNRPARAEVKDKLGLSDQARYEQQWKRTVEVPPEAKYKVPFLT